MFWTRSVWSPGFNFICRKCWSVDALLDMDPFLHLKKKAILLFFFFPFLKITWMNKTQSHEQTNSEWVKDEKQKEAEQEHVTWRIDRPCLSVHFTNHVVLLDCLNWHCAVFALYKSYVFYSCVGYICPLRICSCSILCSTQNDLPLATKREPVTSVLGSVSCSWLSPAYLLSVMLLSWYLCVFLLCPSPSVACCSDSVVLLSLSQHQYNLICK